MARDHLVYLADSSNYTLWGVRILAAKTYPAVATGAYRKIGVGVSNTDQYHALGEWDNSVERLDEGTALTLVRRGTRRIRAGEGVFVRTDTVGDMDLQFAGLTAEITLRHISAIPRGKSDKTADFLEVVGARDRVLLVHLGPMGGVSEPMWDDLRFPATAVLRGPSNPPDVDTTDASLLFASNATEEIFAYAQMPHAWVPGTEIRPHVHWSPTSTNTGDVLWRCEYDMADVNGTFSGSWTSMDVLDAGDGTDEKHQIVGWDAIDMEGYSLSCIIKFKIGRIGGDASDTYTADAKLLEFDLHYLRDTFGSGQEYVK